MDSPVALYLFLLGFAGGTALLALTAYRRASPQWLRWLLMLSALFSMSRYLTLALFTTPGAPDRFWPLRHCWFATSIGLTLPSIFAVDQLVRHPAMTPKKLLTWFSPWLVAYATLILFGRSTVVPDRFVGWTLKLQPGWQWFLSIVQALFIGCFIMLSVQIFRKVPSWTIRHALLWLIAAQLYLGFDGLLNALGRWYFRPFLYSEMIAFLALWYAFETAAATQQGT